VHTGIVSGGSGFFPSFSADDSMISYSVEKSGYIDYIALQNNDIVGQFYTGHNFDNYIQYLP